MVQHEPCGHLNSCEACALNLLQHALHKEHHCPECNLRADRLLLHVKKTSSSSFGQVVAPELTCENPLGVSLTMEEVRSVLRRFLHQ